MTSLPSPNNVERLAGHPATETALTYAAAAIGTPLAALFLC